MLLRRVGAEVMHERLRRVVTSWECWWVDADVLLLRWRSIFWQLAASAYIVGHQSLRSWVFRRT